MLEIRDEYKPHPSKQREYKGLCQTVRDAHKIATANKAIHQRVASLFHSPQHQFTSKQMENALRCQNRIQKFSLKGPTEIIKSN